MTVPLVRPGRLAAGVLVLALAPAAGCLRDNPEWTHDTATETETETETETDTDGATDTDGDTTTGAGADAGAEVTAVTYDLTWSWGQATPLPGGGWTTVNDLGITVEVRRGYLVAFSAALSPCTPASAGASAPAPTLPERLLSAVAAPSSAWAGHTGIADPSQVEPIVIEDLGAPVDLRLGEQSFSAARYCWIHYLAAHATDAATGLPEDLDLVGVTLYLEGTYSVAEGSAEEFTASIGAASGSLVELDGARIDGSEGPSAHVVVTRDLGRAFDGVDLGAVDSEALARAVLGNLVGAADLAITFE
ncbi:MAG: hypothetical protein R3B09_27160 [Nannocystaceae bacterium]